VLALVAGLAFGQSVAPSVFDMTLEELLNLKVSVASRRAQIVREAQSVMTIVTRA